VRQSYHRSLRISDLTGQALEKHIQRLCGPGLLHGKPDAARDVWSLPPHYRARERKEGATHKYDVTGSLCENNDKFAIDRMLPEIEIGDILAIHDTGAHGHAMGFNYNGKLRSAELLLREDRSVVQIRRAETIEDYFATLDFEQLKSFR
jgi:hypothetical protein